jgi:hypothetical protein
VVRGKPKGSPTAGTARILVKEERPNAEATFADAFGLGRKLYQVAFPMPDKVRAGSALAIGEGAISGPVGRGASRGRDFQLP